MLFLTAFTVFHVLLSLTGIVAGAILLTGLCSHILKRKAAIVFLVSTTATSVTGFLFPFKGITPGIVFGLISIPVLLLSALALRKGWAKTFAISSAAGEYLNVFVLIVQLFQKVPFLRLLAPNGSGPVAGLAQVANFVLFLGTALIAARQKVRD